MAEHVVPERVRDGAAATAGTSVRPHPLVAALTAVGFAPASDAVTDLRFAVAQTSSPHGFADLVTTATRPGRTWTRRVVDCTQMLRDQ